MKILLIGWGNMGDAMLQGWVRSPDVTHIDAVSPHAKDRPAQTKVSAFGSIEEWASQKRDVDMAVLAFKPFKFVEICPGLKPYLKPDLPILSVAAGITLSQLTEFLGEDHPFIRTMPNTPSAIGLGMTGYCFSNKAKPYHKDITVKLLSVLGETMEVADDEGINAVSAVSGSGPAYFYKFIESIENTALNMGFDANQAALLARQSFFGAAGLLKASGKDPATLRAEVTSPKGATAAGIAVFDENRALESMVKRAIAAALERNRTLGKN